ncbi:MAG: hypothetical protein JO345_08205 [Streptosporangiaceae bacterium]|nr:hypothetical protein [Streptosporangiaceae bacterium]
MPAGTACPMVSHSQYWIQDDLLETDPSMYVGFNGLVSAQGGVAIVLTGTSSGQIRLTAESRLSAPQAVDLAPWDEVVEVSLVFENGTARILAGMGTVVPGLPLLSAAGRGPYRVRVHARGRDRAMTEGAGQDPTEEHLVIAWPAAQAPETCHKLSDAYGAAIRAG